MNQNENIDQDVDLNYLNNALGSLFKKTGLVIYGLILFIKKYVFLLLVLIVAGGTIGFFLDKKKHLRY